MAVLALSSATRDAHAQQRGQQPAPRIQPEVRADYIGSRAAAAHVGFGLNVPATTYVRVGIVGALGEAWSGGNATFGGRVDGLIRFVVDPLRESRWAPYAAGGLGGIYDGSEKWRGVLVGALGVEGPVTGHVVPALEVGFGGGVRVGVAFRRAMRGRR
jgi:opacity protein-like surface antigen